MIASRPSCWAFAGLAVVMAAALAGGRNPVAFPGAEGFGAATPGGRGGRVLAVTNLLDSGPGSFREACLAKGPRIVVFRVAGIVDLASPIEIREPFLTIAGQSAPGDGVCLRGHGVVIATHDVVIRYVRIRPGDISGQPVDGMSIGNPAENVIVDHVSSSWSVDEALSLAGNVRNVTVQWSLIAEALHKSVHPKGAHGYGSLARANGGVTFHHNLWAHNSARNPRLGDNYRKPPFPLFDVRNNVIYDYGDLASGMTGDFLSANYIANWIQPGPSSRRDRGAIVFTDQAETQFHVSGNHMEGRPEIGANNELLFDRTRIGDRLLVRPRERPFDVPPVATDSARTALLRVLQDAGATRPVRDDVDRRIVEQAREGRGRVIHSQKETGGWPVYRSGAIPVDTDRDGMPDDWEKARKLNPSDPADAAADRDGDGYTNVEEYLNWLAVRPKGAL